MVVLGLTASLHAQVFDHLECHKIKDPLAKRAYRGDLVPRDPGLPVQPGCSIKLPAKLLCTEVEKTNVVPPPPGAAPGEAAQRYLCYKAKCPKAKVFVAVADQFGARNVRLTAAGLLCAPVPAPTTTTTSTTSPPTTTTDTTGPSTTTTTSPTEPPTTTTTLPGPPTEGCPVVNEIMTGGSASASEEFVEILNPCAHAVDLSGARLVYRSAAGTTDISLFSWASGPMIAAGGRLVYGSATFAGPKDGELLAGLAGTGGGVGIRDAAATLLDSVGYGTATNAFVETSAAPAPAAGSSIGRFPDGTDSDDNAADWILSATITPGAPNAGS
jgi:hypothetical protein